jgi:phosphoglycolate phosphatase
MKGIHNLLFDLDGTLVDSRETISASLSYALDRMGLPSGIDERIDTVIGTALLDIFCNEYEMGHEQAEIAIDHYRVHYDELRQAGTHIYPDIESVLEHLRKAGFRLYIAMRKKCSKTCNSGSISMVLPEAPWGMRGAIRAASLLTP